MYTYTYAVYVTCGEKSANSPESSCLCLTILRHLWAYQTIPATPQRYLGDTKSCTSIQPVVTWQITRNQIRSQESGNTSTSSYTRLLFFSPIPADVRSEVTQSSLYKFLECFSMIGAPGNLVGPLKQDKLDPKRPTPPRPPGIMSLNRIHGMDCSYSNY